MLKSSTIPWRDVFYDRMQKAYSETRAHLGLGDLIKARDSMQVFAGLKDDLAKNKNLERIYDIQATELRARFALARGETLEGLSLLADAAKRQGDIQKGDNDPPTYPELLYNALGRAYLDSNSAKLAAQAFGKALKLTPNDIFALSGLVEAHHALGQKREAQEYMARLLFTASGAERTIAPLARALATGVRAAAKDHAPAPQRRYEDVSLDQFGPNTWEPFPAPRLEVTDSTGAAVTLNEYKGKNVILVFYLGRECLHCMKQLRDLNGRKSDWERLDAVVLAVSSNKAEDNAKVLKELNLPAVRVLSDRKFENSRRYRSYDDFEEMELHSTVLIDRLGRVHWSRTGGEPFGKMEFIIKQLERMNGSGDNR